MLLRRLLPHALALILALVPVLRAGVPLDYYLPAGTTYNPKVPTPEQFLGFQVGDWHIRSELSTAYLRAVAAAAPDRVKFEIVGHTHERKPLVVLTITAPENHAKLEQIRTDHLALLDPAKSAALDTAQMPVVVDLGYSIHGNEPSGVNAMPLVVYYLAAAQDEKVTNLLRNSVILVEAQRNPDGGDRAAQWFSQHRSLSAPSTDPADREHNEAWPRGRFNHYWFDPNRDWLPLVHPEAQVRAQLFHRWRPNLLTDHHEMGTNNTFFFQPGVPTRNNPSSPAKVFELTAKVAAFHQRALDGKGIFYYSEQGFDDFYPGKGSTYPDLHGTIGILFEQASARGHAQESENGVLTFPFAIRNQVLSSLSSLDAAVALRPELLGLQKEFPQQTAELAAKSKVKAYVFGDDGDPARAWAFLSLLAQHQIEVRPLNEDVVAVDGRAFKAGAAWVALTNQPQFRLLTEMFIKRTTFEDSVFYDVSAWTLPLAYNLPYAELDRAPAAGDPIGAPKFPAGQLVGGHSDYAYLFNWNGYFAPRALQRLHAAGVLVKGLTSKIEAVTADGTRHAFGYGAILVPVGQQPERAAAIRAVIDTIVKEDALTVYGCGTGLTPKGVDFGSASFVTLPAPRVALITGDGVDPHDIGAAWHVLDQRVGLAPTLLDVAQLGRAELSRYTTVVFADGRYDDEISDATLANLKRWIREGGTLVVMGRAVQWAARKELATLEFAGRTPEPAATAGGRPRQAAAADENADGKRRPYASASDREALRFIAGAIVAASIDPTHPLGYGFSDERVSFLRKNAIFLKPAKSPYETPAAYTAKPLQSGFISEANQAALANTAAVVALPVGRGAVVGMPDDPNFRGFWYGGNRVFFNAIFYGSAIRPPGMGDGGDDAHAHSH
jgi:hypothetical protein